MNMKVWMIVAGAVGGAALLGAGAFAVWNSKQMRTARVMKRAGKILYKVGSVLQSVSCVSETV